MTLLLTKGGRRGQWSPELYPEMIAQAWFQEDLATGAVASWLSRGFKPMTAVQAVGADQPSKLAAEAGVKFNDNTIQNLSWGVQTDTPYINRWGVCISRCDIAGNPAEATPISVVTINGTNGANGYRQPYVRYLCNTAKYQVQTYDDTGIAKLHSDDADTAFADWNVLVWFRRGWQFHADINGVRQAPLDHTAWAPNNAAAPSYFGANSATTSKADVALDLCMAGQGEPSDAFIDRLVAWAHNRVGKALPGGHVYENTPPRVTATSAAEDFPDLFDFSLTAWNTWLAAPEQVAAVRFANRGLAPPTITDYPYVYVEDFTAATNPVKSEITGAKGSSLYAPGLPTDYGIDSTFQPITDTVAYAYDSSGDGTLAITTYYSGGWKAGGITTVDSNGQGRTWSKGIFEIRVKYLAFDGATPVSMATPEPLPGIWPAFWTYSKNGRKFWHTRNIIEIDHIEQVGEATGVYAQQVLHMHNPLIANSFSGVHPSDLSARHFGLLMNAATDADFTPTIDMFDGNYHTAYFRIDDDFTYYTVDDKELVRVTTVPELLDPKYLIAEMALDANQQDRSPLTTETFLMVIDYIKVRRSEADLATVPTGFSARPTIAGTTTSGSTLTITPNTSGSQIDYFWYRDGAPIVTALASTYVLVAADVGHKIRGEVRNLALVNQPVMMTAETATVT